ncbi:hypothetical protein GCM10008171_27690 [Methylopila jiangsuensis]|uniref:Uncharacterized protein n=1 Tax=Methylopila jiangsuensis TaxID=586230 RepID=A0A9W6N4N6_9HYPH|nr:hypothetical protein [Methylopila jiangsuensis]MDR6285098.1 hypothetical protein [Methylopila jiangsuensis]GLK77515.1 hypothetical protein GCM10008171_27690 [Methylopila jiangsuensis]
MNVVVGLFVGLLVVVALTGFARRDPGAVGPDSFGDDPRTDGDGGDGGGD